MDNNHLLSDIHRSGSLPPTINMILKVLKARTGCLYLLLRSLMNDEGGGGGGGGGGEKE